MNNNNSDNMRDALCDYLWYSYLPPESVPEWIEGRLGSLVPQVWTIQDAIAAEDAVFDRLCASANGLQIVPISGGWDSRVILAALSTRFPSSQILTYSFGFKGSLDFELGSAVARQVGVRHIAINTADLQCGPEELVQAAQVAPWTYMPDALVQQACFRQLALEFGSASLWSGFLGDALTGAHLLGTESASVDLKFAVKQQRSRRLPLVAAPGKFFECNEILQRDDWLDLGVRQYACISRIVLGGITWAGWRANQGQACGLDILAPFADLEWARFWLSAAREQRAGQELYKSYVRAKSPRIFDVPFKENYGVSETARTARFVAKARYALRQRAYQRWPKRFSRSSIMDNYFNYPLLFREDMEWRSTLEWALEVIRVHATSEQFWRLQKAFVSHHLSEVDRSDTILVALGLAANLVANTSEGHVRRRL